MGVEMRQRRARVAVCLAVLAMSLGLAQVSPVLRAEERKQQTEEVVSFNVKSHKYHCRTCTWAKRCTANCIDIPISKAKRRGAVACKVCGGSCRR